MLSGILHSVDITMPGYRRKWRSGKKKAARHLGRAVGAERRRAALLLLPPVQSVDQSGDHLGDDLDLPAQFCVQVIRDEARAPGVLSVCVVFCRISCSPVPVLTCSTIFPRAARENGRGNWREFEPAHRLVEPFASLFLAPLEPSVADTGRLIGLSAQMP